MLLIVILSILGGILLLGLILWIISERGILFRKSTWDILRAGGLKNLLNLKLIHLYIYGRWTKQLIGYQKKKVLPRLKDRAKKNWAETTHFKILTPENARSIITLDQKIALTSNEQVIPFSTARDIVLQGPPEIVAYDCGCRKSSPHPCEPIQVCIVVGRPFTDFVLKHHPNSSRLISQAEALEILESEHQRGHVQTAWFKDICLGRFYAICNCCTCCCIGIQATNKHHIPMAASSGYIAQVDKSLCAGCGVCAEACPFSAIQVEESAQVTWEKCLGCGICIRQCPEKALSLQRDINKGEPMDVQSLARHQADAG